MDESIELILKLSANPSTKLALIALVINGNPMTTKQLNNAMNLNKTLDNYKQLLKNEIDSGIVEMFPCKTSSGITRLHFSIDTSKIVEQ